MYKNTAVTVTYIAWDTSANAGKTGDAANHTLRGIGDGTLFTPANPAIAEVDATNCPGLYKATLAAGENNYANVTLHGKSATANVAIIPTRWSNESDADAKKISGQTASAAGAVTFPGSIAAIGSAMTLTSGERDSTATALLDLANAVSSTTLRILLKRLAAVLLGTSSDVDGATTRTRSFKEMGGATEVVTGTEDVRGNRTVVAFP